ncbi:cytochrome-c oxidase, cbb3-type subunit III [Paracoccus zhejiangensis]|uniref:Cbb3-type cytochrome c oxidase subunit n=1 Tax=Paracoccus zhejiangensis TaxID=1077935 RepID=A0A2H5EVT7_9RHOB|nr:cytochrome-c oxidase, cbb3-type subunit III [Paracoccus zhejiangensis]AUH63393.1 cytochrome-c oxidase, cbb3-type subunit III [Paracoccus zhejiangensis]
MDDKETRDPVTGVDTTGHEWDGIRELNNPMPRWWLWTLYGTIVWGIGYAIAYPAWPLVQGATSGLLGYSTRGEVAAEIAAVDARNAEVSATLAAADLAALPVDDPAYQFGVSGGAAVFRANCSQCHGAGAAGGVGYPNLLDDSWLWGGTLDDIEYTVRHGIRNDIDADARFSQMPAFGEMLTKPEIAEIAEHVLALSGQDHDAAKAEAGATLFADNCASCHGETGTGDREQGAPDLTDAIWLYSGTREAVTETITNARFGVMPAWGPRLSDAEIKAVTLYVHQLGGGE